MKTEIRAGKKSFDNNLDAYLHAFRNLKTELIGTETGYTLKIWYKGIRGNIIESEMYFDKNKMDTKDYTKPHSIQF